MCDFVALTRCCKLVSFLCFITHYALYKFTYILTYKLHAENNASMFVLWTVLAVLRRIFVTSGDTI